MTEEVNVGMGAPAPKKGMSKGCLVSIIVAVVIILFVGGIIVYSIYNGEDVVKFAVATSLTSSKQMLVESKVEGVDTTQYNAIVDKFNTELYADSTLQLQVMADLLQKVQEILKDKSMDAGEVDEIIKSLSGVYPDLVSDMPTSEMPDSLMIDSMKTE